MTTVQKIFTPLSTVTDRTRQYILLFHLALFCLAWIYLVPEHSFFPNLGEVLKAWVEMWNHGLFFHILATLKLCFISTFICIVLSSIIAYASTVPAFKPISDFFTKLRFLPITGFTLFLSISTGGGRAMQITMLIIFMSFYFISSLMSMIKDIPEEDFIRRKAQKMSNWQILWKVIILDRLDFLVEAIRLNLSITFMMIVSVEIMDKAQGGLGAMLTDNTRGLNFPKVFALQLTIFVVGILLDYLAKMALQTFPSNKKNQLK